MKKLILCIFSVLFLVPMAKAGGFLYTRTSGEPISWESPTAIPLHPESGSCGDYSHSEMMTIIEDVLNNWSQIPEVDLGFDIQDGEIDDITTDNFNDAYYGGSDSGTTNDFTDFNPIIFDDDGSIHADLYGSCENLGLYLGVATITHANGNGDINRASFVLNCACFRAEHTVFCDDNFDPCDFDNAEGTAYEFSEDVLRAVFQHEMGHFLNLDHTPLYEELFDDSNTLNDDNVPLMYPFLQNPERDITPKQDDIVALATLYPSDTFEDNYCVLTGTVLDQAASANELQCGAVLAINTDQGESVSFVTGMTASGQDLNGDGDLVDYTSGQFESTNDRGRFVLYLKPNQSYEISLAPINSDFIDAAQVNPCNNEQLEVCTQSNLDDCNDDDPDTDCEPCISEDILISRADYAVLYRDLCEPGEIIDVGNLTAEDSISLETALALNGGSSGNGDDSTSGACELNPNTKNLPYNTISLCIVPMSLLSFRVIQRKDTRYS